MTSMRETTKGCLTFEARPSTPPEIRKYRRSTNLEPGKRFQHHGVADDINKLQLEEKIFGITDSIDRVTASDLINHSRPTELERLNMIKAERSYRNVNREPLGKSPDKKTILPSKFTESKCNTLFSHRIHVRGSYVHILSAMSLSLQAKKHLVRSPRLAWNPRRTSFSQ